jgi:hypothetical protein
VRGSDVSVRSERLTKQSAVGDTAHLEQGPEVGAKVTLQEAQAAAPPPSTELVHVLLTYGIAYIHRNSEVVARVASPVRDVCLQPA